MAQNRPFFLSFQTEWKNESYLTQWHTKGLQNIKLVFTYSKSVSCENSKRLHFVSLQMKHIHVVQNRPFFSHSKQNEKVSHIWHNDILYSRLPEYQISFPLFKVSEPWKFQMSSLCVSSDEKHSSKQAIFSLIRNRMKKWVIFDTMAYEILPKYHISFLLFKVSEAWKFQMSSFCVSTSERHSPKQAILFSHSKRMKNESFLIQWDTKGFQNIRLVCLYSESMSHENS